MPDYESEYNNRARVPEHPRHIAAWAEASAAYRAHVGDRAILDVAYGSQPRQRLDIFLPVGGAARGLALFFHGGYWQALAKASFSHMAAGANAHGVAVVVAGYTLCPETSLGGILAEARDAVKTVVRRFGRPVTVFGHSAGGHLAACLLATDWSKDLPDLGFDAVPAALPVSGLFELEPLVQTSINEKLGLTPEEARRLSPVLWPPPKRKRMVAVVGGAESSEFRRQTHDIVEVWSARGVAASAVDVPEADHFTVIAPFADPQSDLTRGLVALATA